MTQHVGGKRTGRDFSSLGLILFSAALSCVTNGDGNRLNVGPAARVEAEKNGLLWKTSSSSLQSDGRRGWGLIRVLTEERKKTLTAQRKQGRQ